jgi:hypothetical protein
MVSAPHAFHIDQQLVPRIYANEQSHSKTQLTDWYYCRAAVVFSIQSWLGESEETKKSGSTPGYFTVGMSLMSLLVTYLPIFLPPPPGLNAGSATGAPQPAPVPAA